MSIQVIHQPVNNQIYIRYMTMTDYSFFSILNIAPLHLMRIRNFNSHRIIY